jgi:membrane-bound ClpP family serine protease
MTFAYWSREIAGWALILIGLIFFARTYDLLLNKRVFEAAPMAFIGFIVFRGGIHVLKVAVAAQAARSLPESAARATARRVVRATARPVGPTPAKSVLPGPKPARPGSGRS